MSWKPVYLFWGDEWYLKKRHVDKFINQIPEDVRDFNLDIFEEQDVTYAELKEAVSALPVFSDKRLIILKNSRLLSTTMKKNKSGITEEQLIQVLNNLNPTSCLLILAEGNVDKRKKTYKLIAEQGEVLEFLPLKGRQLLMWLKSFFEENGKKITKEAAELLLDSCANSLTQLAQEAEKLILYAQEMDIIDQEIVSRLTSRTNQETIFKLIDSVAEKDAKSAFYSLRAILDNNEPPLKILFMLTKQFRLILQVKVLSEQGKPPKALADILNLSPFVIRNCLQQSRKYSLKELRQIFQLLLAADNAIKTGKYEPRLSLELLVAELVG